MKKFILSLILFFTILPSQATNFSDLKFGASQFSDTQWNVGACLYTTTCQIYGLSGIGTSWNTGSPYTLSSGQYIKFSASGNNTYPWTMNVYNSNGTLNRSLGTGMLTVQGEGTDSSGHHFFFFTNSQYNGTVFSTDYGFPNSNGFSFTGTLNPTVEQTNSFATTGSTSPLTAGQTYTAGPPPPAPTKIYKQGTINGASVYIINVWPTSYNSPGGEGAANAFDNNVNTKYLNFDKYNAGVTVQLNSGRVVTGFTLTTANDFSGRDPTKYRLYGSNDGVTWTLIQAGDLSLSESRYTESAVIDVTNTTAYAFYYIMFPSTKAGDGCGQDCNSMQIGGIAFVYDSNSTTTSTSTMSSGSTPSDPVQSGIVNGNGSTGPTVEGGTITQTNASTSQTITSGGTSTAGPAFDQQSRVNNWINSSTRSNGNNINLNVNGSNNSFDIEQVGNSNTIKGIGEDPARITGSSNSIKVRQGTSGIGQNEIQLRSVGDQNNLDISQARTDIGVQTGTNGHYQAIDVNGYNNTLVTRQSNSTIGNHYQETTISGNQNNVTAKQLDNGNKIMFTTVNGNNNIVDAVQRGVGQHYLETKLSGNGNSATVIQEGTTANKANIDLTNAGGAASIDLIQSGGKNLTIQQTCVTAGGCGTIIRQNQ